MVIILKNSQQLLEVLRAQLDLCKRYLQVQKSMTDALVVGDIRIIDSIVKEEQYFLLKLESLENKRLKLLEQESLAGLDFREVIEKHSPEEFRSQLESAFEVLVEILGDLKRTTQLNQRLLKQRLSVFDSMVDISEGEPVRRA